MLHQTNQPEGVLVVDKPAGMTSHDVVNRVRRAAGTRRVGHAGTLDPMATGVLLLGLGRATRLIEYLAGLPKSYEGTVRLGQTTNSYDAEGGVIDTRPVEVDEAAIREELRRFEGEIEQVPPMYSAIKQGGQPLYKLARRGIEVERAARPVTIYELKLVAWQKPDLRLSVVCSAGTYIRSLAHDLGQALGSGGHLAALRRTAIGDFTMEDAVALEALSSGNLLEHLRPPDAAVAHLPRLDLPAEDAERLAYGQPLLRRDAQPDAELARAYDAAGRFIAVAALEDGAWRPKKVFGNP